jgi:hypothetical protein
LKAPFHLFKPHNSLFATQGDSLSLSLFKSIFWANPKPFLAFLCFGHSLTWKLPPRGKDKMK